MDNGVRINVRTVTICYKSRVKFPVHAMELGAVLAINVVFQIKVDGQLLM